MPGNRRPHNVARQWQTDDRKINGQTGNHLAQENRRAVSGAMNEKCPQIAVSLALDLDPTKESSEYGAQQGGLHQGESRSQWLKPMRIPIGVSQSSRSGLDHSGVVTIGSHHQNGRSQQAQCGWFQVFAQFFSNQRFHSGASVSERMNDFSPRPPR